MSEDKFAKRLNLLWQVPVALLTAQGFVAVFVHGEVIELHSVLLLAYQSYTAVITDNIRRLFSLVGLSVTREAADYLFIFIAFTVPLVTSLYRLHPTREDWERAGRRASWQGWYLLSALTVLAATASALNVMMGLLRPEHLQMMDEVKVSGVPFRLITITVPALMSLARLWWDWDLGPAAVRNERRDIVLRTAAVIVTVVVLVILSRFIRW